MKKNFITFCLLIMLGSCISNNKENVTNNTNKQDIRKDSIANDVPDSIYTIIHKLIDTTREYKAASKLVKSTHKHKYGASVMIDYNPPNDPIYIVHVGDNREDRYETFFTWSINIKTAEIRITDILKDGEDLSLAEYRRKNKQRGYQF